MPLKGGGQGSQVVEPATWKFFRVGGSGTLALDLPTVRYLLRVRDARFRDEERAVLGREVRGVHDRGFPFKGLVLLEPLRLELEPEVAPVGDDVAADGVVLGKPRPEHAGRDRSCRVSGTK